MGGNTRLLALVLALLGGCASASSSAPSDGGADLTAAVCDPKTLFTDCSAQCGTPICVVAQASCAGSTWTCDCTRASPCGADMRRTD